MSEFKRSEMKLFCSLILIVALGGCEVQTSVEVVEVTGDAELIDTDDLPVVYLTDGLNEGSLVGMKISDLLPYLDSTRASDSRGNLESISGSLLLSLPESRLLVATVEQTVITKVASRSILGIRGILEKQQKAKESEQAEGGNG